MYPGYFKNPVPPMYSIPPCNVPPGTGQNPRNLQDTRGTMARDIRYISLHMNISSQPTYSSTHTIPNNSFGNSQDQLTYSYPSFPNSLEQFNNTAELPNDYLFNQT